MPSNNSRGTYSRERVKLTVEHVKKAKSMVANGRVEGRGHEFVDTACPGLVLRVTPQAATWYLRLRETTIRIGAAEHMPIADIRTVASRAKLAVKDGADPRRDLKVFEHAMVKTGDPEVATNAAFPELLDDVSDEDRRRHGPWQWRDLVDAFLEAKRPKLDPGYVPQYESYLRHPAFQRIAKRTLTAIKIEDLEWVRDDIIAANTLSAAKRSVQQAKEALSWAWRTHARRSGLGNVQYEWWTRWTVEYQAGVKDHTPTVQELARTLALAERHRTLGQTEHATSPGTLAMLWAVVLTAQRTYALSQTMSAALVPWDERPGWWVLGWPGPVMKSRSPHGLPLPALAQTAITAPVRKSKKAGSQWLFPSVRIDGPVSPNSVNQLLDRLGGIRNSRSKGAPLENLLEAHGIRRWTPHDVRRAISSYLGDRRLGGAASAILDHAMDGRADERERTAQVTRLHYDRAQRMGLKADGMELWVRAVMEAYIEEKVALDALPPPAPRVRTKRRPRLAEAAE